MDLGGRDDNGHRFAPTVERLGALLVGGRLLVIPLTNPQIPLLFFVARDERDRAGYRRRGEVRVTALDADGDSRIACKVLLLHTAREQWNVELGVFP